MSSECYDFFGRHFQVDCEIVVFMLQQVNDQTVEEELQAEGQYKINNDFFHYNMYTCIRV